MTSGVVLSLFPFRNGIVVEPSPYRSTEVGDSEAGKRPFSSRLVRETVA